MKRPSDEWLEFGGLEPGSERFRQIQHIISSVNFEQLEAQALAIRNGHAQLPPGLSCAIQRSRFISGFDNLVMELAFSDDVLWIVRMPHRANHSDTAARTAALSEIFTMKIVRERTSIPVPCIYAFELSADQPVGHPYVLMEYLAGKAMPDRLVSTVPPEHLKKVAQQMANVLNELQGLTFDRIGRLWGGDGANEPVEIIPMAWHHSPGPLDTSLEYFYNHRQGENQKMSDLHPQDPDWLTACWVLKSALPQILIEDRVRGPFPLCHYDLHCGNILFDEDFNLVGVVDWGNAQAAPLEHLSVGPEYMVFPGMSDEGNAEILRFKSLIVQFLAQAEERSAQGDANGDAQGEAHATRAARATSLSTYLATQSAEITLRSISHSARMGLFAGRLVAKLMYGEKITWDQLKTVYGEMPLF